MKIALLSIMLALALLSCQDQNTTDLSACGKPIIVSEKAYQGPTAFYNIESALLTGDCLEIIYSSSGCDGSTWETSLADAGVILESFPVQRNIKMILENAELCDAVFLDTAVFDLSPIQLEEYTSIILNISGFNESILYEYGK